MGRRHAQPCPLASFACASWCRPLHLSGTWAQAGTRRQCRPATAWVQRAAQCRSSGSTAHQPGTACRRACRDESSGCMASAHHKRLHSSRTDSMMASSAGVRAAAAQGNTWGKQPPTQPQQLTLPCTWARLTLAQAQALQPRPSGRQRLQTGSASGGSRASQGCMHASCGGPGRDRHAVRQAFRALTIRIHGVGGPIGSACAVG
jgi:hypothetical protein